MKYVSNGVRSSVNAHLNSSIKSATKWSEGGGDVDRFVEWHDDTEMYMYPEVFDAIYEIFDNALGEGKSEDVREAFQRLSKEDQEKVMKLIESTGYDIKSATGWSEGSGDVSDTFLDLEDYIHELATMVVNRIAEQGYFCDYNVTGSELIFEVYLDGDGLGVFTQPIIEIGSDLSSDADLLAKDILLAVK